MTSPITSEELLAREAIRCALTLYTSAGERGRWAEQAAAFHADGTLMYTDGTEFVGREAIAGFLDGSKSRRPEKSNQVKKTAYAPKISIVRIFLSEPRIEFDGSDAANVWTNWMILTGVGPDHSGVYVDRFTLKNGQWLIQNRRIRREWVSDKSLMHTEPEIPPSSKGR